MSDFIPNGWTTYAEWVQNFTTHFNLLAAKYGLETEMASMMAANSWVQYWIQAKFNAKQQEKQLTDYIEMIVNGDQDAPPVGEPVWTLPPTPPANIAAGLTKKIRSLARQIKANPLYTEADGELLGIVAPGKDNLSPDETAPEISARSLSNFAVEVGFRKSEFDALRVEFRYKNGNWTLASILTSSPGVFNVVPASDGEAEQIEIRAVYLVKNQPFGSYSPSYNVIIQP